MALEVPFSESWIFGEYARGLAASNLREKVKKGAQRLFSPSLLNQARVCKQNRILRRCEVKASSQKRGFLYHIFVKINILFTHRFATLLRKYNSFSKKYGCTAPGTLLRMKKLSGRAKGLESCVYGYD